MIRDHAQRRMLEIGRADFARSSLDQILENIDFIIRMHMLQHGRNALEAHAGIDARTRQRMHHALLVAVELHEYEVPDFNETVAIFFSAARRAAPDVRAMVIENFRTRTARAGIGHLPEIIGSVTRTLVIADADDALNRHADFVLPDAVSFVIFMINSDGQLIFRQAVD